MENKKKKYFFIQGKIDDYGCCNRIVIYEDEKVLKKYVYYYKERPKKDYEILKKYLGDFYEYYDKNDFEYFE